MYRNLLQIQKLLLVFPRHIKFDVQLYTHLFRSYFQAEKRAFLAEPILSGIRTTFVNFSGTQKMPKILLLFGNRTPSLIRSLKRLNHAFLLINLTALSLTSRHMKTQLLLRPHQPLRDQLRNQSARMRRKSALAVLVVLWISPLKIKKLVCALTIAIIANYIARPEWLLCTIIYVDMQLSFNFDP